MNEVQYAKEQEQAENVKYAVEVLAVYFDCDETQKAIERAVYKETDCGAWVKVQNDASILFGSIVEGSDAEFTCDAIPTAERDGEEIASDIKEALTWLEAEVDAAWHAANDDEDAS